MGHSALEPFHPAIRTWFEEQVGAPSPAQAAGWPAIGSGRHTLILAPTGSGKTLAAFLWFLHRLYTELGDGEGAAGRPGHGARKAAVDRAEAHATDRAVSNVGVRVLYISPLRALNYDIERNLRRPLREIPEVARRLGYSLPEVSVAVRTGDTPPAERRAVARRPPAILITTPESLYLMLTSRSTRPALASVRHVIVDELHALAPNKRGAHLSLSLERLEALTGRPFQRIGLSATQRPLDRIAAFLGGFEDGGRPRPVEIVDLGTRRAMDLQVVCPVEDLRDLPGDTVWPSIDRLLARLIEQHRSTLVFVNYRGQAERLAGRLNELLGRPQDPPDSATHPAGHPPGPPARHEQANGLPERATGRPAGVRTHHGSLSRHSRREVELSLKEGRAPAVVATSSLELGIDIGSLDLVVQVESPKSVARGLQRVGRAGHLVGAGSKGRIVPKQRSDLLEAAAVSRRMLAGRVEETRVPENCLDVLAQQLVAMAAVEDWEVDGLLALVRRAYGYRHLQRESFEAVLGMLAGDYDAASFAHFRPRLVWDRASGQIRGRESSRLLAVANAGTIPDRGTYGVYLQGDARVRLGELDEEFVFESREGEVFILGSATWRIERIRKDRVIVSRAAGSLAKMPFWRGDALGRPYELGLEVGRLTREIAERLEAGDEAGCERWLQQSCALDPAAARNLVRYVADQFQATGAVPTDRTVVVEHFLDDLGDHRVVIHSPFGSRINAPWALALVALLRERLGVEVQSVHRDEGILLHFAHRQAPPPLEEVAELAARDLRVLLLSELGNSPVLAAAFREAAERALLLPRSAPGRRRPLWLQRLRAADLLQVARRMTGFPVLVEALRTVLEDWFDLQGLEAVLKGIRIGEIRLAYARTRAPSPFAAGLMFSFTGAYLYEKDMPRAERRSLLLSVNRSILERVLSRESLRDLLDPEAIRQVEAELRREYPEGWASPQPGGSDRHPTGGRPQDQGPAELLRLARRFARTHGPFTTQALAGELDASASAVEAALATLEASGEVVRGEFSPGGQGIEWCDPEVLRRIHRLTLKRLRQEIEAVDTDAFARFLQRWQGVQPARPVQPGHLAPGGPLRGLDRLREVLSQLQGLWLPLDLWEQEVLPLRVPGYDPRWLDALTTAGEFLWVASGSGGTAQEAAGASRAAATASAATAAVRERVAFFAREQIERLWPLQPLRPSPPGGEGTNLPPLSDGACRVMRVLQVRGAQFFDDLVRASGLGREAAFEALRELVRKGLATNDAVEPLRASGGSSTPATSALGATSRRSELRGRRWGAQHLKRQVRAHLAGTLPAVSGRWSLVPGWMEPPEPSAAPNLPDASAQPRQQQQEQQEQQDQHRRNWALAWAEQLLARYGLLSRELAAASGAPVSWGDLYPALAEMEALGEIQRGYFVEGLSGLQYARRDAIERLREASREVSQDSPREVPAGAGAWQRPGTPIEAPPQRHPADSAPLLLNACDPANPYPGLLPLPTAERVDGEARPVRAARLPSVHLVLESGRPVLLSEGRGHRLTPLVPPSGRDQLKRWLAALDRIPSRRLVVENWNGRPVLETEAADVLAELGFHRGPGCMERWAAG